MSLAADTATLAASSSSSLGGAGDSGALRPTTTSSGYKLPALWSFPPFFTLQPNPATQAHQLALWSEIVLGWARHDRVFAVNADSPDAGDVFVNKAINRKLLPPALKQVLAHMAKEGHAAPEPPRQAATYLIFWRKPEEWGQIIYDWVSDNGMTGTILTFYDLTDGDLAETTEFRGLPDTLLRRSLDTLVKRGKAQLLRGEGESGDGVRFL
ncbi:Vacuolar protein-sorting-associated protein 25 [Vanrija pseudolonga]|uniref:ESCRT-II complex subunit VPS25 n=1 Tax=Vanrija pseudolonga TaxID=143232 RepID=A0AAF0XZN2_9TREE|nr:Vacuolar protein-sorting-associated protein 25 [Vanrija pseudolonga]